MRKKSWILVIVLAIIGVSMLFDSILLIAAPPTTADVQKGTETVGKLLDCINDKINEKGTIDISDTVECLPGSCTVTLTMSDFSAQEACGSATTCQLPRVILKCPGPPQAEITYLLCGTGSAGAGGVIGSNRIEVGVVVGSSTGTNPGSSTMLMADIPIPPGTSTVGKLIDVLSLVTDPSSTNGSKGCNTCCHLNGGSFSIGTATLQLSERIEVFQEFANSCGDKPETILAPFIIYTDDKKVDDKLKELRSGADADKFKLKEGLKEQALCEICDCIDEKIKDGSFFTHFPDITEAQAEVLLKLCRELEKYQNTRGMGTPTVCITPSPSPTPETTPTPSPEPSPTEPPTAVEMVSFGAKSNNDGSVTIRWKTATEIDNAGFNLYRSSDSDGQYTRINNSLIDAKGNASSGARYRYVDEPGEGKFYYLLEDIDYNGNSTLHGPVINEKSKTMRKGKRIGVPPASSN